MKKILLTLILISAVFAINAQNSGQTIFQNEPRGDKQIGEGTFTFKYPIDSWHDYSYTQTIYMASELGGVEDDITKIWYYYAGNSLENSNNWEIYLGNTTKSSYSNKNDFIPISQLTKVYDGTFSTLTQPGWVEFDITDFHYDGTSNLVIAVHDKSPNNDGSYNYFNCTDLNDDNIKRTLIAYRDGQDVDMQNPTISSSLYYLEKADVFPNVRLLFGPQQLHDLGVSHVSDDFAISGHSVVPQVTIKNEGSSTENSYTVSLYIQGTSYSETVNVTTPISNGEQFVVDMPQWSMETPGIYNFTASVSLSDDTNASNNKMTTEYEVVKPVYDPSTIWSFVANSEQTHGVIDKTTGAYTPIADEMAIYPSFFACGDYIKGVVYGIRYEFNDVYCLIPDGRKKKVGTLSGLATFSDKAIGLAYDVKDDKTYVLTFDNAAEVTRLYTVDENWHCTIVGNVSRTWFVSLAADNEGHLYGIESTNFDFLSIDKQTGAATLIGPVGYDLKFAQDIGGDQTTGEIYGTIFDQWDHVGRFGKFDKSTGHFTQIKELGDNYTMCAVIPSVDTGVEEFNLNVNIYPNPSKGTFYFDVKDDYKAEVFDITGKTLSTKELSETDNMVRIEKTGMYFIKLSNKKGSKTFKVIVNE